MPLVSTPISFAVEPRDESLRTPRRKTKAREHHRLMPVPKEGRKSDLVVHSVFAKHVFELTGLGGLKPDLFVIQVCIMTFRLNSCWRLGTTDEASCRSGHLEGKTTNCFREAN